MKKRNYSLPGFLFVIMFLIIILFGAPGCSSGSNVGDVVCDYGSILCEVSTTLCRDVPGVPAPVCDYLDLACYNLNVICELREDQENVKYQAALDKLQEVTDKLKAWRDEIANQKQSK